MLNESAVNLIEYYLDHSTSVEFVKHDCSLLEAFDFVSKVDTPVYGRCNPTEDRSLTHWLTAKKGDIEVTAFLRGETLK